MSNEVKQPMTVNALSEELGVDRRTMKKAVAALTPRRTEGKNKYYDPDEAAAALENRSSSQIDKEIKAERLRRLKQENDAFAGKFIDREELASRLGGLCVEIDATLKAKLINEWPATGAGMPADELRKLGQEQHTKIVNRFKEFAEQWG